MSFWFLMLQWVDCRSGINTWRDSRKPREILVEFCRKNTLAGPSFYGSTSVKVSQRVFHLTEFGTWIISQEHISHHCFRQRFVFCFCSIVTSLHLYDDCLLFRGGWRVQRRAWLIRRKVGVTRVKCFPVGQRTCGV